MVNPIQRIWIDQCAAAEAIAERFGRDDALRYLVGEKLLNFVRNADQHAEFAAELPAFVAEVATIFSPWEIRAFVDAFGRRQRTRTEEERARYGRFLPSCGRPTREEKALIVRIGAMLDRKWATAAR